MAHLAAIIIVMLQLILEIKDNPSVGHQDSNCSGPLWHTQASQCKGSQTPTTLSATFLGAPSSPGASDHTGYPLIILTV